MNDEDYGFFGLTFDEYQILLEDIGQAVEEGNRKYGYGCTITVASVTVTVDMSNLSLRLSLDPNLDSNAEENHQLNK